ncbi:YCF48-related protein [Psychrosphaera sp. 1_MG-2023]|uniref:WD40/YVTN/BNR-like repeat-containing protein n=1 Tax=Psychrosphaera sp. 1_MG-2023 TaxID=3062643 RepID=UPI0026E3F068|nr:YCF48-related protein [Psychrosphaera sp. 1_MG-2023]MDO6720114.1 YCF48-related protein [Psychrosphaera sp. 1_MG-2023]
MSASSFAAASTISNEINDAIPAFKSKLSAKSLLTDIELVGDTMFAVGERGHIIYSSDGDTWLQADVPVNVLLTAIKFVDSQVGFAIGHDQTLLKTENGGKAWQIVNYQPSSDKPFLNLDIQGQNIVIVGAYGLFWSSNDGGKTWDSTYKEALLLEEDRQYLQEIKEFEPEAYETEKQFLLPHFNGVTLAQHGWYLSGEGGFAAVSYNQGKNWERLETEYYGSYFSVQELAKSNIILAGLRGNVFSLNIETGDFDNIDTPVSATINSLLIKDETIYMFANSGNLFIYKNGVVTHKAFADGKAILSGTQWRDTLVMATEAGIKSISINKLPKQ